MRGQYRRYQKDVKRFERRHSVIGHWAHITPLSIRLTRRLTGRSNTWGSGNRRARFQRLDLWPWIEHNPVQNIIIVMLSILWSIAISVLLYKLYLGETDIWYYVEKILLLCGLSVAFALVSDHFFVRELYEPEIPEELRD